jgi:hypothetical protein
MEEKSAIAPVSESSASLSLAMNAVVLLPLFYPCNTPHVVSRQPDVCPACMKAPLAD